MKKGIIILTILFIVTLSFAGWKKVFHRYSFRDAVQTTDGNFLVIGDKWGDFPTTKSYLYWRHIYRETGLTIPGREYKDSDDSDGYFVIKTKDKGYLITGKDYITGKIIAIKLDSSFSLQWRKMHGRPGDVGAPITCCTQEGGYFLFHSLGYYRYRFNLIKLDSLGDSIWIRDYDSLIGTPPDSYDTYPRFVVNTLDRNYILGLHIRCAWIPYLDTSYLFIKIDESGDIIWTKSSDIIYTESSCHPTFDSSFIHVGYDYLPDHEIVVTKYDREFDTILWRKTYCYKKVPLDIIQTSDSGYAIFGRKPNSDSTGTYLNDYMFLMKLDPNGDSLWCKIYDEDTCSSVRSIVLLDDGGFLMLGGKSDGSILILADSLGDVRVTEPLSQKPEEFSITVSPNPFNSSCQITAPEAATVTIFDLRGKLVTALSSHVEVHKATSSKRSYIWQPEQSVSSGIYIVKVSTDNRSTSKNILYIK